MMNRTDKEEYIIGSISLLSNKITLMGDSILPDITFKQWFLLMMISKIELQEKNLNSIAEVVGTTRQNVKKMLVPLENKGYVHITKSKSDARALNVQLTHKTYEYFADNNDPTAKETNKLFSAFSMTELDDFVVSLNKLLCCFDSYGKDK